MNNPEITELLRKSFVPIAIDNLANPQWTLSEAKWLANKGGMSVTIGMTIMSPGGKVFAEFQGSSRTDLAKKFLKEALADFQFESDVKIESSSAEDRRSIRTLPKGGLAMNVGWKVLKYDKVASLHISNFGKYNDCFTSTVGADRLWVSADESKSLVQGEFPESLKRRITHYHLNYVFLGEMKEVHLAIDEGRITGTAVNDAGDELQLLGHLKVENGRVVRFDLLARGIATYRKDGGFSGPLAVVPKNTQVPAALLLELTDPTTGLGRVPPHHIHHGASYWHPHR